MKELRRKSKIVLFSALIICSMFGGIRVKAQPMMLVDHPDFIVPEETIYMIVYFEYENTWQMIKSDIYLLYDVNGKGDDYDYQKIYPPDTNKPEEMSMEISTSELNLKFGDNVRILVWCEWGNLVSVQGELISEEEINVSKPNMWLFNLPDSILPKEENIYVTIRFSYGYETMIIKGDIDLYYNINNQSDFHKFQTPDTNRPEEIIIVISTSNLNLKNEDIIRLKVRCDWGNALSIKGTLIDEDTVSVYKKEIPIADDISIRLDILIVSIVVPTTLIISAIITILIRRRKRKKFV